MKKFGVVFTETAKAECETLFPVGIEGLVF
jgi:hypothetical protein